jgi:hypothetical protein
MVHVGVRNVPAHGATPASRVSVFVKRALLHERESFFKIKNKNSYSTMNTQRSIVCFGPSHLANDAVILVDLEKPLIWIVVGHR